MIHIVLTDRSLESTEIGTTTADSEGEGTHKGVYLNLHIWYGDVFESVFYFDDMFGSVFHIGDVLESALSLVMHMDYTKTDC